MIAAKRFSGVLNKDDQEQNVLPPQHIAAKNGRFVGGSSGLTFENIKGNYVIPNSDLPPGNNECIGSFKDEVNQIIYWFNWNQYGVHGIYKLSIQTGAISTVFKCLTNSVTDVLNFSLDYPITSCQLVYRPDGEGNLLYWTDGLNRPMYLNLDTVSTLSPFTANMLYVAKMPPLAPPTVAYASDATKNFNNVKNRYFRFAYRWSYKNNEKSTFSPTSILPIPPNLSSPQNEVAPNTNNYITVQVSQGSTADYQNIEIFGQEFNGASWGDFFLITSVLKTSIPAGDYTFPFYNDGIYNTILPAESDLRFDYVPDAANTLELLNGNTIIYGGITEGYDVIPRSSIDVQITSSLTALGAASIIPTWKWANNERLGLVYFDEIGKTNGVVSYLADATIDSNNFNVTTPQYNGQTGVGFPDIPKINASINHLPPSWASTYQWVRIDSAPPFYLQYLTNDYQTDSTYIYLCIEGLKYNNTNQGYVPSYEFTAGDRVRVKGSMDMSGGAITPFSTQYDFQIIDVVTRTMGGLYNTATDGSFLKCLKPASFPTPAYSQFMFIEIYTPPSSVNDSTAIFYEWGQKYDIYELGGIRYHRGQVQNQTGSQAATFEWTNGYMYFNYNTVLSTTNINLTTLRSISRYYNCFQESKANSNSRGWPIDANAKQEYFPVTSRWGGSYVQDTNINNINRFYPQDLDTIDRAKGDIRRFKTRDRILRVFQDRGVGQYGVYAKYIQNNSGDSQLTTTNEIITTNNINYYDGVYGLSGYPTNLVSTQNADYFTDVVTGRGVRLSTDGMTDLGLLYKGQYYFTQLVTPYNKTILRSNGAVAKVMGYFDIFNNEYHTILQGGAGDVRDTADQHFSFNETRNGYCCDEYDFHPEWAISMADITYSWKGGYLYKHDSTTYCNFYGVQYGCHITLVFNENLAEKKSWNSISEVASDIWACPVIYGNVNSYSGQRQETNLVAAEFSVLESMPTSAIKRDAYSSGGKVNGGFMKGNWLAVKFEKTNASNLITLSEVIARFTDSPLTVK